MMRFPLTGGGTFDLNTAAAPLPRATSIRIIPTQKSVPFGTAADVPAAGKPVRADTAGMHAPYALMGDVTTVSVVCRSRGSMAKDAPSAHGDAWVHVLKEKRHQYNPPTGTAPLQGGTPRQHSCERAHNPALKTTEPMPYGQDRRSSISPFHRRKSIELAGSNFNARLSAVRRFHIPGTAALEIPGTGIPPPAKVQHRSRSAQPSVSPIIDWM